MPKDGNLVAPAPALVLFDIDGTLLRGAGPHHKEALISGVHEITRRQTSFDGIETAGTLDRDLIVRLTDVARQESVSIAIGKILDQSGYLQDLREDRSEFIWRWERASL